MKRLFSIAPKDEKVVKSRKSSLLKIGRQTLGLQALDAGLVSGAKP
jgi:hypothetical protein